MEHIPNNVDSVGVFPLSARGGTRLSLIAAERIWVAKHRAAGQPADHSAWPGRRGSGHILAVESNEELTTIRAGDPFAPFSDVEIYPLSDLEAAFDAYAQVMLEVTEARPGRSASNT